MPNSLFLLCPTDCLESPINNQFKQENYFYTSLGNSLTYDRETIAHLKESILKNNISEIYFILALDNQIILDALERQDYAHIGRLNSFYGEIAEQKEQLVKVPSYNCNLRFSILSYHLNKKIKELRSKVGDFSKNSLKIKAKIYNRDYNTFTNIYSDLIFLEKYQLN